MTQGEDLLPIFRDIEENYREIVSRIGQAARQSGRTPQDIRFMAVTKTVAPELINHALGLGVSLIGENKVQELLGKLPFLQPPDVEKHLIGHLQSNKVKKIVTEVSCIQSVDSLSLAEEISRQAERAGVTMDVLLEVNIGDESSKTGLPADALGRTGDAIAQMPGIRVRGLMSIPPVCGDPEEARPYFEKTRRLFEALAGAFGKPPYFDTLSMGMSADYVQAILEGATLVRVGSALFGARRY